MAFKMKYSGGTPFHFHGGDPAEHTSSAGGIDPKKLDYKTTETAKNLAGESIDIAGTATVTVPGTRKQTNFSTDPVERDKQKQWIKDNPELYEEMIAETKPREATVTRERDYSQKRKIYPNPFKGMSTYKGVVLSSAAKDRDSLESKTITNIFKQANDKEGFTAYLDKYNYKLRKGKTKKPTTSESLSDYKYTIN
tara:strand:- start:480 stop:1064 length:585 start_codon:yes stop_codon:yes gene_type:complete